MSSEAFDRLLAEVRACTVCAPHLPLGPRPVLRGRPSSRLLIISQAPGTRVHETGVSFNDRSGDRLREWLALDRDTFYDESRVAIMPIGLCYPGRGAGGGDLSPRRECAPRWHTPLRALLPAIELTLLVGSYAIYFLPAPYATALNDRDRRALAGLSPGILCTAASELAHDRLAARQSLVRERGLAGLALQDRQGARSRALDRRNLSRENFPSL
jgi:uracil-DNA glycosylase